MGLWEITVHNILIFTGLLILPIRLKFPCCMSSQIMITTYKVGFLRNKLWEVMVS